MLWRSDYLEEVTTTNHAHNIIRVWGDQVLCILHVVLEGTKGFSVQIWTDKNQQWYRKLSPDSPLSKSGLEQDTIGAFFPGTDSLALQNAVSHALRMFGRREVKLTRNDWWKEIGQLPIPSEEMRNLLRVIVSTAIENRPTIPPQLSELKAKKAKVYLPDLFFVGDEAYAVVIFKPDNPATRHHLVYGVRGYPDGTIFGLSQAFLV